MSAPLRAVCFTLNNPECEIEWPGFVRYGVYQKERGESGTDHFQGYCEFNKQVKFGGLKKWLPAAHFEVRKGSRDQARSYCMKSESRVDGPWEFGSWSTDQGKRSDVTAVKDLIFSGASKRQILEDHPEVLSKYPRFVDLCLKYAAEDKVPRILELDPKFHWQKRVLDMISEEPNDRQILWIHDPWGNHGKTYLAKHLVDKHRAYYCNGGKSVDLLHAYNGERVVVFDYVRDAKEYVGYGVIEQLKNGIAFSPKYESGLKRFAVPHVMVFANFCPEEGKFSHDRVVLVQLNGEGEIV